MKKFAKISAVIAVAVLALAFSGCSDSDDDDDDVHVSYPSNSASSGGNSSVSSSSSDSLDESKLVGTWSYTETRTSDDGYYMETTQTMEITGTKPNSNVFVYILKSEWHDEKENDGDSFDHSDLNDGKGKLDEDVRTFSALMNDSFSVLKKGEKIFSEDDEGNEIAGICTSSSIAQTDTKIEIFYTVKWDGGVKMFYSIVANKE